MMKQIGHEELQNIEYDILCAVADFCEENGISYGLASGTLLGAVRHGDFIPWDDDIDIEMPRPDYERFLRLADRLPPPFRLSTPFNNESHYTSYAKVIDIRTLLIEFPETKKLATGVYVDIFPVDGMPDDPIRQERHRRRCRHLSVMSYVFHVSAANGRYQHSARAFPWKCLAFLQKHIIKGKLAARANRLASKYPFYGSRMCSLLTERGGIYIDTLPRDIYMFEGRIRFRDREFRCVRYPEAYLAAFYGDYLKLPPEEERLPHNNAAWWKD